MAAHSLPQEVAEHLEAAIHLSNRRVYLRLLDEAEALVTQNPGAVVMVASVVLESLLVSGQSAVEDPQRIQKWSALRNRVASSQVPAVSIDEAREMVERVRLALLRESRLPPKPASETRAEVAAREVRGKYKFVPTNSEDFIRRKADELKLEHDERGD